MCHLDVNVRKLLKQDIHHFDDVLGYHLKILWTTLKKLDNQIVYDGPILMHNFKTLAESVYKLTPQLQDNEEYTHQYLHHLHLT